MQATDVQTQIDELNTKLDLVLDELAHQKRQRLEMQDLKDDLTIVAKDLYQTTVVELEEISDHVKPGDLVYLLKKLLRNVNNISATFDQLESLRDMLADLTPITKEVYSSALVTLEDMQHKGYFELARHARGMADDAVGTVVEEDLEELRENIPRLIRWTKSVTHPETLQAFETMVVALTRGEAAERKTVSLFKLLREMNTPEARRGLAAFVEFVKGLGAPRGAPALESGKQLVKPKE